MLLIETLRNKPSFSKNGELIKDLTYKSVEFREDMLITDVGVVTEDLVMRADLFAKIYFRNANRLDYLLKFNGISNPFSIDAGDLILIPSEDSMKAAFKPKTEKDRETSRDEVVKKFFDPNRLNKKDKKRLEYLKKKSAEHANGSKTNLPPNFAEPGSKELRVVDGKVVFGGDVVANKEHCPDPLSKARAKSKLIQNKIFKNTR
jgi:hypothetical protein